MAGFEQKAKHIYPDFQLTKAAEKIPPVIGVPATDLDEEKRRLQQEEYRQSIELSEALDQCLELKKRLPGIHRLKVGRKVRESLIPNPGLLRIDDNYYTGWSFVRDRGPVASMHRTIEGFPQYQDLITFPPYYYLSEETALTWHKKMRNSLRNPLRHNDLIVLQMIANQSEHPEYTKTKALPPVEQAELIYRYFQEFVAKWPQETSQIDEAKLLKLASSSVVKLSVYDKLTRALQTELLKDGVQRMDALGLTVFGLSDIGSLVSYKSSYGEIEYRSISLPKSQRSLFQRYLSLGDTHLSADEMQSRFIEINPNSRLQF